MKNFLAVIGLIVLIVIAGLIVLLLRNGAQPAATDPIPPTVQPIAQATVITTPPTIEIN